ncbi:MAG: B12-binding domain-containing radical SAM protein [Deltaproteobacteria bacterium]|nr:B12-binding domain-containing radical SAM protein [Deltaproteobacteria bacterium]
MRDPPALSPARPRRPEPRSILLVNPFYPKDAHASFGKHVLTPSLALTSLAGATPPDWSVRFWDENLLQGPPPEEPLPQVVGITVHLTSAVRAYELAAWFRARGSVVVLGGLHALSCPDEVGAHADAVAVGNGVPLWPRILEDVLAGRLERRYDAPYEDYDSEPVPDRSILPPWGFLTPASLIATRGCHNRCDFCYLSTGTNGSRIRYQTRCVEKVAKELEATGSPYAVFIDNNLGSSRNYLRRLCQALAPLEKIWSAAVSLDVTDDPSLVRDMALSGCTGVFIGFETLTDSNLENAGKRGPKARDYARRVALLHDNGIQVNGSFVLGFDEDRPDVFARTVEWIEEHRLECATFHIMTPYPATPLFARLEAEGRILHRDWSLYDAAHAVFRPRHMTPQELEAGWAWMYSRLFSARSIWARRPAQAAAVAPYLAMAYLYKRANPLWTFLIRHRLTHAVWSPLVEATRRRHLAYRRRLAVQPYPNRDEPPRATRAPALLAPAPPGV